MKLPPYALYTAKHHRENAYASGLSDETITLAEIESTQDPKRIYEMLHRLPPGKKSHDYGEVMVFPFYEPLTDKLLGYRIRPDNPRAERKGGKNKPPRLIKYDQAPDLGILPYFAPRSRADGRLKKCGLKAWAEGEKKSLLLDQLGYAVIGLTGVHNFHDAPLYKETGELAFHPLILRCVEVAGCDHVIAFDSDARDKKEVMSAAKKLAHLLYRHGAKSVTLAFPPAADGHKCGVDDYFMEVQSIGGNGADAIAELLATGTLVKPDDPALAEMPEVRCNVDESKSIDEAILGLARADLYVRSHGLVRVLPACKVEPAHGVECPDGTPIIRSVAAATLRETLAKCTRVVGWRDEEGWKRIHPPPWLVEGIAARGIYPCLRPLVGVTDSPILMQDGSVVTRSGYHAETMMLVQLAPELEGLSIPEHPTQGDAEDAAHVLLDLVVDFPFATDADRASWLAALISCVAREAYRGPTPLFLVDATALGTGKTILAQLIPKIVVGRDGGAAGYAHDSAEMGKRIMAIALKAYRIVLLDNIEGPFGNEPLCRAITSTVWMDRVLGKSEQPALPLLTVFLGSSNNAQVQGDMSRRVVPIRLVSPVENPHERTGFKHPDVLAYAGENRAKFLHAALTMVRAFLQSDRDVSGLAVLGSFEGWRKVVCGTVRYATGIDPLAARGVERSSVQNDILEALRTLFTAMVDSNIVGSENGRTARELMAMMGLDADGHPPKNAEGRYRAVHVAEAWMAVRDELDIIARRRDGEPPVTANRLGTSLRDQRDRTVAVAVVGGSRLMRLGFEKHRNRQRWWVEDAVRNTQSNGAECRGSRGSRGPDDSKPDKERSSSNRSMHRAGGGEDRDDPADRDIPADDFEPIETLEDDGPEVAAQ